MLVTQQKTLSKCDVTMQSCNTPTHMHMHACTHTHSHTHAHTHMHTHMHAHTHAHTHAVKINFKTIQNS